MYLVVGYFLGEMYWVCCKWLNLDLIDLETTTVAVYKTRVVVCCNLLR